MKKIFIILSILACLPNESFSQNRDQSDSLKLKYAGFQKVSMVSLLANPKKYQGKRIQIEGYLHLKYEDAALYLSKQDADYLRSENAYWVRFADKVIKKTLHDDSTVELDYYDSKYIIIRGIFNYNSAGHLGAYAGAIESIDYIFESRQWYDGGERIQEMPNSKK